VGDGEENFGTRRVSEEDGEENRRFGNEDGRFADEDGGLEMRVGDLEKIVEKMDKKLGVSGRGWYLADVIEEFGILYASPLKVAAHRVGHGYVQVVRGHFGSARKGKVTSFACPKICTQLIVVVVVV
jgi:hypothetical protein